MREVNLFSESIPVEYATDQSKFKLRVFKLSFHALIKICCKMLILFDFRLGIEPVSTRALCAAYEIYTIQKHHDTFNNL